MSLSSTEKSLLDSRPQPNLPPEQVKALHVLSQIQPENQEVLRSPEKSFRSVALKLVDKQLGNMKSTFRATADYIAPSNATDEQKDNLVVHMLSARLGDEAGMVARVAARNSNEMIGLKLNQESWQLFDEQIQAISEQYNGAIIATMHSGGLKAGTIELADHLPEGSQIDMIVESAGTVVSKLGGGKAKVVAHTVGKPVSQLKTEDADAYDTLIKAVHTDDDININATRLAAVRTAVSNLKTQGQGPRFLMLAIDRPELSDSNTDVNQFNTVRQMPNSPAKLAASSKKPIVVVYPRITNGELHMDISDPIQVNSRNRADIQIATQQMASEMEQLVRTHPDQWVVNRPIAEIWPYQQISQL